MECSWVLLMAATAFFDFRGGGLLIMCFALGAIWVIRMKRQVETDGMRGGTTPPAPIPSDPPVREEVDWLQAQEPVAVLPVGDDRELGPDLLPIFKSIYRDEFSQVLFLSVGVLTDAVPDSGAYTRGSRSIEEARRLRKKRRHDLDPYLSAAHALGMKADCRVSIGASVPEAMATLAKEVMGVYPRSALFVGKVVLEKPRWFHRFLFNGANDSIRAGLEKKGLSVTIIPVVVRP